MLHNTTSTSAAYNSAMDPDFGMDTGWLTENFPNRQPNTTDQNATSSSCSNNTLCTTQATGSTVTWLEAASNQSAGYVTNILNATTTQTAVNTTLSFYEQILNATGDDERWEYFPEFSCDNATVEGNCSLTNVTTMLNCTFLNDSHGSKICSWEPDLPPEKQYLALLLLLFPILTVFGNVLVILSIYKERSLQTVTNYFIISLAVADLLVAALVMPFAVYFLVNVTWGLSPIVCDFYIAMDVICSTSSIFNLVAISIDRFIAVTQPIKYAKHKSSNRIVFTIAVVWVVSAAIGLPIVFGLNTSPERDPSLCVFYNSDFILYSSLSSFYIPCIIMVILYYRIFKVIRERAKKAKASRRHQKVPQIVQSDIVIENVAQTRNNILVKNELQVARSCGNDSGAGSSSVGQMTPPELDQPTSSNSQEGDKDESLDCDKLRSTNVTPSSELIMQQQNSVSCQPVTNDNAAAVVIQNNRTVEFFQYAPLSEGDEANKQIQHIAITDPSQKAQAALLHSGCNDSGYGPSTGMVEQETQFTVAQQTDMDQLMLSAKPMNSIPTITASCLTPQKCLAANVDTKIISKNMSSRKNGTATVALATAKDPLLPAAKKKSRFLLVRTHKSTKKKQEKSAARKERKATKTLAIVLGVFLFCWVPFFTCNIWSAVCIKLESKDYEPSVTLFVLTTWLGYMNSFINPVIYTIFNPEFRKAFKKILFPNR